MALLSPRIFYHAAVLNDTLEFISAAPWQAAPDPATSGIRIASPVADGQTSAPSNVRSADREASTCDSLAPTMPLLDVLFSDARVHVVAHPGAASLAEVRLSSLHVCSVPPTEPAAPPTTDAPRSCAAADADQYFVFNAQPTLGSCLFEWPTAHAASSLTRVLRPVHSATVSDAAPSSPTQLSDVPDAVVANAAPQVGQDLSPLTAAQVYLASSRLFVSLRDLSLLTTRYDSVSEMPPAAGRHKQSRSAGVPETKDGSEHPRPPRTSLLPPPAASINNEQALEIAKLQVLLDLGSPTSVAEGDKCGTSIAVEMAPILLALTGRQYATILGPLLNSFTASRENAATVCAKLSALLQASMVRPSAETAAVDGAQSPAGTAHAVPVHVGAPTLALSLHVSGILVRLLSGLQGYNARQFHQRVKHRAAVVFPKLSGGGRWSRTGAAAPYIAMQRAQASRFDRRTDSRLNTARQLATPTSTSTPSTPVDFANRLVGCDSTCAAAVADVALWGLALFLAQGTAGVQALRVNMQALSATDHPQAPNTVSILPKFRRVLEIGSKVNGEADRDDEEGGTARRSRHRSSAPVWLSDACRWQGVWLASLWTDAAHDVCARTAPGLKLTLALQPPRTPSSTSPTLSDTVWSALQSGLALQPTELYALALPRSLAPCAHEYIPAPVRCVTQVKLTLAPTRITATHGLFPFLNSVLAVIGTSAPPMADLLPASCASDLVSLDSPSVSALTSAVAHVEATVRTLRSIAAATPVRSMFADTYYLAGEHEPHASLSVQHDSGFWLRARVRMKQLSVIAVEQASVGTSAALVLRTCVQLHACQNAQGDVHAGLELHSLSLTRGESYERVAASAQTPQTTYAASVKLLKAVRNVRQSVAVAASVGARTGTPVLSVEGTNPSSTRKLVVDTAAPSTATSVAPSAVSPTSADGDGLIVLGPEFLSALWRMPAADDECMLLPLTLHLSALTRATRFARAQYHVQAVPDAASAEQLSERASEEIGVPSSMCVGLASNTGFSFRVRYQDIVFCQSVVAAVMQQPPTAPAPPANAGSQSEAEATGVPPGRTASRGTTPDACAVAPHLLSMRATMLLPCIRARIINDVGGMARPLMDVELRDVSVEYAVAHVASRTAATVSLKLSAQFYNAVMDVWEPFIESTPLDVEYLFPQPLELTAHTGSEVPTPWALQARLFTSDAYLDAGNAPQSTKRKATDLASVHSLEDALLACNYVFTERLPTLSTDAAVHDVGAILDHATTAARQAVSVSRSRRQDVAPMMDARTSTRGVTTAASAGAGAEDEARATRTGSLVTILDNVRSAFHTSAALRHTDPALLSRMEALILARMKALRLALDNQQSSSLDAPRVVQTPPFSYEAYVAASQLPTPARTPHNRIVPQAGHVNIATLPADSYLRVHAASKLNINFTHTCVNALLELYHHIVLTQTRAELLSKSWSRAGHKAAQAGYDVVHVANNTDVVWHLHTDGRNDVSGPAERGRVRPMPETLRTSASAFRLDTETSHTSDGLARETSASPLRSFANTQFFPQVVAVPSIAVAAHLCSSVLPRQRLQGTLSQRVCCTLCASAVMCCPRLVVHACECRAGQVWENIVLAGPVTRFDAEQQVWLHDHAALSLNMGARPRPQAALLFFGAGQPPLPVEAQGLHTNSGDAWGLPLWMQRAVTDVIPLAPRARLRSSVLLATRVRAPSASTTGILAQREELVRAQAYRVHVGAVGARTFAPSAFLLSATPVSHGGWSSKPQDTAPTLHFGVASSNDFFAWVSALTFVEECLLSGVAPAPAAVHSTRGIVLPSRSVPAPTLSVRSDGSGDLLVHSPRLAVMSPPQAGSAPASSAMLAIGPSIALATSIPAFANASSTVDGVSLGAARGTNAVVLSCGASSASPTVRFTVPVITQGSYYLPGANPFTRASVLGGAPLTGGQAGVRREASSAPWCGAVASVRYSHGVKT
ncbi:hypothetical protein EON66_00390, partial [archaeon]